jgi:hypothetical protein
VVDTPYQNGASRGILSILVQRKSDPSAFQCRANYADSKVIRLREDGQRELIESAMGIDASLVDEIESSPSFSSLAFNRDVG